MAHHAPTPTAPVEHARDGPERPVSSDRREELAVLLQTFHPEECGARAGDAPHELRGRRGHHAVEVRSEQRAYPPARTIALEPDHVEAAAGHHGVRLLHSEAESGEPRMREAREGSADVMARTGADG